MRLYRCEGRVVKRDKRQVSSFLYYLRFCRLKWQNSDIVLYYRCIYIHIEFFFNQLALYDRNSTPKLVCGNSDTYTLHVFLLEQ